MSVNALCYYFSNHPNHELHGTLKIEKVEASWHQIFQGELNEKTTTRHHLHFL